MIRPLALIVGVVLGLGIAGCGGTGVGTIGPDGTVAIPTSAPGATVCETGGIVPFTLQGSPTDPDHIWGVGETMHDRIRLRWPPGFTGRLGADIEVIDPTGRVVARSGDVVTDAGGGGGSDEVDICQIGGRIYLGQ